MFRGPGLVGVGVGGAGKEQVVTLFDLLEGVGVVVSDIHTSVFHVQETAAVYNENLRGNGNVTAVDYFGPGIEWVRFEWDVVAATKSHFV